MRLVRVSSWVARCVGTGILAVLLAGCSGTVGIEAPAKTLTVMTYNIHHGEGTDELLDLERIARVIEGAGADIVGLQEVDRHFGARSDFVDQPAWLAERLDMHYVYGPAIVDQRREAPGYYGVLLLSKYPILDHRVHRLFTLAKHEPRVCLEATVRIEDRPWTFMVTHLDHKSNDVRIRQVDDILGVVPRSMERTVLMGDFNTPPPGSDSKPEAAEPIVRVLGVFKDGCAAADAACGESFEGRGRIDYVFVSPDLADAVTSCAVVRDEVTAAASDHFPVIVTIKD